MEIFKNEIPKNSIILIDSFDTLTDLHPKNNMMFVNSFGTQTETSLSDKFKDIVENGYRNDIYVILFVDNFKRTKQKLNLILDMFNYRLAFSLNNEILTDFLSLEYNVNLPVIKNNKGLFSNILTSNLVEFKFFRGY